MYLRARYGKKFDEAEVVVNCCQFAVVDLRGSLIVYVEAEQVRVDRIISEAVRFGEGFYHTVLVPCWACFERPSA